MKLFKKYGLDILFSDSNLDYKGVFSFESQIYPKLNNEEYETLCKMKYKMVDRIINT